MNGLESERSIDDVDLPQKKEEIIAKKDKRKQRPEDVGRKMQGMRRVNRVTSVANAREDKRKCDTN